MSRTGSLCRYLGTLVKRNKNQLRLYDNKASQLGSQDCDAEIPGGNFPSNQACRVAPANEPSEKTQRTAGNTLVMRIASNLHIKMAASGWPFSCNNAI